VHSDFRLAVIKLINVTATHRQIAYLERTLDSPDINGQNWVLTERILLYMSCAKSCGCRKRGVS
jgi:hypothetical protein